MDQFYVYILQSRANDSFYKGSTNDLVRRFHEHNKGEEISTARYLPWDLVWFTIKPTRPDAFALELKLKNLSVQRTIDFIRKYPVNSFTGGPNVAPVRQSGC
jgi:putative endonuclease